MPRRWPILVAAFLLTVAFTLGVACQQAEPTPTQESVAPTPTPFILSSDHHHHEPCGPIRLGYSGHLHEPFLHWEDEGSSLIFRTLGEAYSDRMWAVTLDDGQLREIIDVNPDHPSFSSAKRFMYGFHADVRPNDSRIVYSTCEYLHDPPLVDERGLISAYSEGYELALINPDGTGQQRLTRNTRLDHYPVWSPDGSRIAFVARSGGYGQERYPSSGSREAIKIALLSTDAVPVDGHEVIWLWSTERVALSPPVWSPDGQYLAYIAYEGESIPYILVLYVVLYVVRADRTKHPVRIAETTTTAPPVWLPGGEELVYATFDDYNHQITIFAIKRDGSDRRILWQGPGPPASLYTDDTGWSVSTPALSPDGSQLLFIADHTYLIGTDGSGLRRLEGIPEEYDGNGPVAWSPDGSRIAIYDSDHSIITVSSDGTDLRVLMEIDRSGRPRSAV